MSRSPRPSARLAPRSTRVLAGAAVVATLALTAATLSTPALGASAPSAVVVAGQHGADRAKPHDYGHLRNILPPGSNGNVTALQLLGLGGSRTATPTSPPHFADQLETYDKLTTIPPDKLKGSDLGRLYKDETLTPQRVVSTESPRSGLTIRRDAYGVPFIKGATYDDVEFGAGYAAIEDRMFLMDVLRHTGRAQMASFVGNTPANVAMDAEQLRAAPYTPAQANAQIKKAAKAAGAAGKRLLGAADAFVAGINAAQRKLCPSVAATTCPVEYAALQKQPTPWTRADVVYIASLVGGIFGKGGGTEVANARWLQQLEKRFGARKARTIYEDLRERNDPEAPTTATVTTPYQDDTIDPTKPGVALPDLNGRTAPGTGTLLSGSVPSRAEAAPRSGAAPTGPDGIDLPDGTHIDFSLEAHAMSNALLVDRRHSRTGHPLAVMGPQTGYYAPQLLTEEVLDGPHLKARGVAFAGTNLFVQLGRGLDYAWSATSAGSDNIDTVVERLCNPRGKGKGKGKVTVQSLGYEKNGHRCVPMGRRVHTESTTPNLTAPAAPTTYKFLVLTTNHGVVQQRTTVNGKPVAIVAQRSTFGHDVDSVIGFSQFNDPGYVHDARSYARAASHIDFTFNWFYADSRDIGYFSSGRLPERSPKVDADLPHWAGKAYDWRGWLPASKHAQQINPPRGYLVSWNNKEAPGFGAADDQWGYGPVYRSLALEKRLQAKLHGGHKVGITDLVAVMSGAATADSRARYTLPYLLKVLGKGGSPALKQARSLLTRWLRHDTPRVDRDRNGAYGDQAAIAIFDRWWAGGVARDVLRGKLGKLVNKLPQALDDHPNIGRGSAFNGIAWYGYVNKDLRMLLGQRVRAPYSTEYCGGGKLALCRNRLRASLARAVSGLLRQQGVSSPSRLTYDKTQDDIRAVTGGVVGVRPIDWQNRPTFQQVVPFTRHR